MKERDRQLREFFDQRELELLAEHRIAQHMPHLQRYRGDTLTPWAALQALREYYAEERSK